MRKIGQSLAVLVSGEFPPVTSGWYQEHLVLVKGRYAPDVVVVEQGEARAPQIRAQGVVVVLGDGALPGVRQDREAPRRRDRPA